MAKRKPTKGKAAGPTLREQWESTFRNWRDLLPRRVKFGFEGSGRWIFQLENDEQKRAAGWEPAHSFQPGPDGSFVRVDHLAPPQALFSAAWVLADMARRLADRGAQLRVDGSRRLREFEHALRFSGGISRNPLLLWEDGIDDIVDDVLAAQEGEEPAAPEPSGTLNDNEINVLAALPGRKSKLPTKAQADIANKQGISEATVSRAIKRLRGLGLVHDSQLRRTAAGDAMVAGD